MTAFGKTLVLVTVALSLVFLGYALVVFAYPIDWNAKLVEGDKQLKELAQAKQRAGVEWAMASNRLQYDAEANIAAHQVAYAQALELVQSDPSFDKVKDLKYEFDPMTGPVYGQQIISNKTYDGYLNELKELLKKMAKLRTEIDAVMKKEETLTEQLDGKVDAQGKKIGKGLYDLIAHEREVRQRAQEELEELQPGYFQTLVDSQLLLERQKQLLGRIQELENSAEGK